MLKDGYDVNLDYVAAWLLGKHQLKKPLTELTLRDCCNSIPGGTLKMDISTYFTRTLRRITEPMPRHACPS